MQQPNIIFVTIDCFRYDRVSANGYAKNLTPSLDRLINEEAANFSNAFANGPNTLAAFPALMTSSYSTMYAGTVVSDRQTIANVLSDAGYHTIGLSSNPYLTPEFGYDGGFDVFFDTAQRVRSRDRKGEWLRKFVKKDSLIWKWVRHLSRRKEVGKKAGLYPNAATMCQKVIANLENRDKSRPFFLWCHYMDLHYPFNLKDLNLDQHMDNLPSEAGLATILTKLMTDPESLTNEQRQIVSDIYDISVTYLDQQLGLMIEELKSMGLWDDAIFVVTADHGEELLEEGGYGHGGTGTNNPFSESVIHIPLTIKHPEFKKHAISQMVCQLDIPSTLAEFGGAAVPDDWLGRSLLPLLAGKSYEPQDEVFTQRGAEHSFELSYRTLDWKLIYNGLKDTKKLFRIGEHIIDSHDIAREHPEVVGELHSRIREHMKSPRGCLFIQANCCCSPGR